MVGIHAAIRRVLDWMCHWRVHGEQREQACRGPKVVERITQEDRGYAKGASAGVWIPPNSCLCEEARTRTSPGASIRTTSRLGTRT